MNSDRARPLTLALVLAILPLLAACEYDQAGTEPIATFGEANNQTNMAQVIDPDPQYEYLDPATSGEHAAQAIERYRKDKVKKPERIDSTTTGSGTGSGNSGSSSSSSSRSN